ncbi:NAD(P)-binding domain-containing protein [Frigidibacter sp. RF13]|uniref:NAD(P)-binding domain-containing protein n=1 Tax=Frigidibacter sp. RF13 TaxID=2997340 RepID=UPI00226F5496|nr:NAD(P)-binding domain-containing protein [Frigidibacter sp. RF13]MCY1126996.1 NAD(P)-binding domain-containing protein [Frigidibacter sp. RF13]
MSSIAAAGTHSALPFLAARLRDGGWPVARPAQSGDEAVETLLFMPRDLMESERLLFEEERLAKALPSLRTIIILSTLSPRYVRALRGRIAKHVTLIDAPVIGAQRLADGGQVTLLLGGPVDTLDALSPLFAAMAGSAVRMGDYGTAMAAKALQDCLAAASSAITRSALGWAEAQGIDEQRMLPFLRATFGPSAADGLFDPAALMPRALPEDNAGEVLVKTVESALDKALTGAHLTPPTHLPGALAIRPRHLH